MKGRQSDTAERPPEQLLLQAQEKPTGLAQVAAYDLHDDGLGGEDWRDRGIVW